MKKQPQSSSAAFDEHERDTAQRAYPKGFVEEGSLDKEATARIAKEEIEAVLRKDSGTRPTVSRDDIERFTRERLARAVDLVGAPTPGDGDDPHSRPTIDVVPPLALRAATPAQLPEASQPAAPRLETPQPPGAAAAAPAALAAQPLAPVRRTPGWVVLAIALGLAAVFSGWMALGFALGRLTAR